MRASGDPLPSNDPAVTVLSHSEARATLVEAFGARRVAPSAHALQAVQAIAHLESFYGASRNNWGSIQCRNAIPPCPPECSELTDKDANGDPYQACYRVYPSPLDGASDLVRLLYSRPLIRAALEGEKSAGEIAQAMRQSGYFEAPVDRYAFGIRERAKIVAYDLREPYLLGGRAAPPPAPPKKYASGATVAVVFALVLAGLGVVFSRRG